MKRLILSLAVLLSLVLPGLTMTASPAEAASPYCDAWANSVYDQGSYNVARGGYTCTSHAVPARWQVCIYQGSTQLWCEAGSKFSKTNAENVTCSNVSTANAYFRTWSWVEDDDGGSEGVWSVQSFVDRCV